MKVFQSPLLGVNATTGPRPLSLPFSTFLAGDELTSAIVLVGGGTFSVGDDVTNNFVSPVSAQNGPPPGNSNNVIILQYGYDMTGVIILATFQRDD